MPNDYFEFKQFKILQNKCLMKVGTDAVLLGAWIDTSNYKTILDVGTGTGVIALMIAQKSNFDFIENIFFISEYNEFIELHMMSECSHNIISNSTFSWWASFLNKNDAKKIICPNTWFNKCDEIKNEIRRIG